MTILKKIPLLAILAAAGLLLPVLPLRAGTISGTVGGGRQIKKSPAVVYLANAPGPLVPPARHPVMDQKNMTFIPHVLAIQAGTTVDFLNSDEVRHNVFSPSKEKYNLGTWPQGRIKQHTFPKKGVYTQLCNVHPEMEAFVVVLDTPYFATTRADGSYEIRGVPAGEYTVRAWHEKLKFGRRKGVAVPATGTVTVDFSPHRRRR